MNFKLVNRPNLKRLLAISTFIASATIAAAGHAADGGSCVGDIDQIIARQPTPEMTKAALPQDLVAKLTAAAQDALPKSSSPGVIVGVRTPQGTWVGAFGKAAFKTDKPMQADMHTRIGSITKTVTGTILMRLVQDHLVSLDDPIEKYIPGVPNGTSITLRELGNMTSGVASYTRSEKFLDVYFAHPETVVFTPKGLLDIGLPLSPLFPPGERFDYSNSNTVLLGLVIEKVTKKSYEDAVRRMVIEPLKLRNTSAPGKSTAMPKPFPEGFTLQGDTAKPDAPADATHWTPTMGWAAGEIISTADDLLTFGRAMGTGQGLLSPEIQKQRLQSIPDAGGYGINFGCIDGWVGHTGELPGYNTTLFYQAANDITVSVQANSDISSGDCKASPTLVDDSKESACSPPAVRVFAAVADALGHKYTPIPKD